MTEVFKTEKGDGLKGWESLTELNQDEAATTWEDLASLAEESKAKKKAESDPDFERADNMAAIYNVLQEASGILPVEVLLKRSDDEIEAIRQLVDNASAELFPQEDETELKVRDSLVAGILSKLHFRKTKEESSSKTTQFSTDLRKREFLARLAKTYTPENTEVDSALELARISAKAIDEGDKVLFGFINGNLSPKHNTDDLLKATEVLEQVKKGPYADTFDAQKTAIGNFYAMGGMHSFGEEYLTNNILALYHGDAPSYGENTLIMAAIPRSETPEGLTKMDYVFRQLIPRMRLENKESNDTSLTGEILAKMVNSTRNVSNLTESSEIAFNELVPFVTKQKSQIQYDYARKFALGSLTDRAVRLIENEETRTEVETEISKLIGACNAQMMPILDNLHGKACQLEWKLADEAYAKNYDTRFTDYLRDEAFPRIRQNDKELGGLLRDTNLNGEEKIANFEFNCVTQKINPRGINDILMQRYELPTGNARILEQNRVDALAIEHVVISDHAFIHAEYPERHELIQAMINYYDSAKDGDANRAAYAKEWLQVAAKELRANEYAYGGFGDDAFDLNNYDKVIKGKVNDDSVVWRDYDNKAIDILRRLEENTRPQKIEKPELDDKEWQELIEKVDNEADWQNVGDLVAYTNRWLISRQNQYGLTPAKVEAIAYAERMATLSMREITEKERVELPYDTTFKEFVRFQELIGGHDSYNDERFEEFYSNFSKVPMDIDKRELRENFSKLQEHVVKRSRDLVKYYKKNGRPEREYRLQSNNLYNELIRLTDPKPARTLRERADYMAEGLKISHNDKNDDDDLLDETR